MANAVHGDKMAGNQALSLLGVRQGWSPSLKHQRHPPHSTDHPSFRTGRCDIAPHPINQHRAGFVKPQHLHRAAMVPQAFHHLVECGHGGDVPEVGVRHVDDHRAALQGRVHAKDGDEGA